MSERGVSSSRPVSRGAGHGTRPRLGISTCLLGENVRYDGGHRHEPFLTETFGRFVEWVPVCPEVEVGLGVPREPIRLLGNRARPRLATVNTHRDLTAKMLRWARRRLRDLENENLAGFVLKSRSPSCGTERVKVFDENGTSRRVGTGIWARALMEHFPLLPIEDETHLRKPEIRENFIERVFCLTRYRDTMRPQRSRRKLIEFHAAHELQLRAHSPKIHRRMRSLMTRAGDLRSRDLFSSYEALLLRALKFRATPRKNAQVLLQAVDRLKGAATPEERNEMLRAVEQHRRGAPLIVPITLISHFARKYGEQYLVSQTYLTPDPAELALRNHA